MLVQEFMITLSDKISPDKIFVGQNISSDKILDTKPKFRQLCLIFAWLFYWNIEQNFRRIKLFLGQNFQRQAEMSTILPDEFLSDKVFFRNALNKRKPWISAHPRIGAHPKCEII